MDQSQMLPPDMSMSQSWSSQPEMFSQDYYGMSPINTATFNSRASSVASIAMSRTASLPLDHSSAPTSFYNPQPASYTTPPPQFEEVFQSTPHTQSVFSSPCTPGGRVYSISPSPSPSRKKSHKALADQERMNPKRPLNAFMLYRRDKQHAVPSKNHQSISRIIGQLWRNETAATKKFYTDLAMRAKEEHEQMYPGYKFAPKKKKDKVARRKAAKTESDDMREREIVAELLTKQGGDADPETAISMALTGGLGSFTHGHRPQLLGSSAHQQLWTLTEDENPMSPPMGLASTGLESAVPMGVSQGNSLKNRRLHALAPPALAPPQTYAPTSAPTPAPTSAPVVDLTIDHFQAYREASRSSPFSPEGLEADLMASPGSYAGLGDGLSTTLSTPFDETPLDDGSVPDYFGGFNFAATSGEASSAGFGWDGEASAALDAFSEEHGLFEDDSVKTEDNGLYELM
ncbi:hypothetical protein YB2330_006041 [Saitoella coloradoensis]